MPDDVVVNAQVVLEGVDKITPAANAGTSALNAMSGNATNLQQQLLKAAQAGTQAFQAATQGLQATTQAVGRAPPAFKGIAQAVQILQSARMGPAFLIYAAEEFIRHSYLAYAETEKNMRRVQVATGETGAQIEGLKKQFQQLASEIGRNLGELTSGFRDFMSRSGLQEGDAADTFKQIAKAADTAGLDVRDMSRLTGAAMADLRLKLEDMPQVTGMFAKALATLGPGSAPGLEKVIDQMALLGMRGPKAVADAAAMLELSKQMTGDNDKAVSVTVEMLRQLHDPEAPMSLFNRSSGGGSEGRHEIRARYRTSLCRPV